MFRKIAFIPAVLALCLATGAAENTPELKPAEIAAKNAAARGGLEAWRAVRTMIMTGETDAGRGVKLPYVMELKRPRKSRFELKFKGTTAIRVYDGVQGWKTRPYLGRSEWEKLTPAEQRAAAGQSELDGFLIDYERKGYKLELLGHEAIEGRDAYKLAIRLPGNITRHLWVDASTFLEVKIDSTRKMDGKERLMETYIRDYRTVAGLLIPHLLETVTESVKEHEKLSILTVAINPRLNDSRFVKP